MAVNRPTAGNASIAYNGATLENCDLARFFYADTRTWGLEIGAYAACRGRDNLSEVILSTTLTFSPLRGRRGPLLRNARRYRSRDSLSVNLMGR